MARPVHYGRKLKRAIDEQGLIKSKLAERLKMSRVTLDKHLADGNFVGRQLIIVKKILHEQ